MVLTFLFIAACVLGAFSGVLLLWTAVVRHLGHSEPGWFYRAGITSCNVALVFLAVGFIGDLTNALFA